MNKTILPEGFHIVKISRIYEGESEISKTPFFKCYFENEFGAIPQRFYIHPNSLIIIDRLFETVGIEESCVDTKDLLNKELVIKVRMDTDEEAKQNKDKKKYRKVVGYYKSIYLNKENEDI